MNTCLIILGVRSISQTRCDHRKNADRELSTSFSLLQVDTLDATLRHVQYDPDLSRRPFDGLLPSETRPWLKQHHPPVAIPPPSERNLGSQRRPIREPEDRTTSAHR
jgi:hypothetical protein